MTEQWLIRADEDRADPPMGDRRTRAALIIAMTLGIPLLHAHISRAAGADIRSGEGERRVAMALLDLYSHPLVTPGAGGDGARGLRVIASDVAKSRRRRVRRRRGRRGRRRHPRRNSPDHEAHPSRPRNIEGEP